MATTASPRRASQTVAKLPLPSRRIILNSLFKPATTYASIPKIFFCSSAPDFSAVTTCLLTLQSRKVGAHVGISEDF
jgi:hypothetical protein